MRITAKLAYSQLKINRSRTIWTLLAIILSTALTTTVCSFVASGNAMLVDFLGEDYGVYGQSYFVLLLIPAVILGLMIIVMSITVISNVFRVSTQERITQFGILKCTGATKKQITDTVLYESVFLCIVGIPIGILSGIFLAFSGMQIANLFLDELNALAHIMIQEIHLSLRFVFSWKAILTSAAFCFLTVIYSAWRPAHKAAAVPAIECIRGTQDLLIESNVLHENKLVKKLFGFEGILADKNLKRNRRNFRATLTSLSVGVILFVSLGGLSMQASAIENFMDLGVEQTVIIEYQSNYTEITDEETGTWSRVYPFPIGTARGEEIVQKLEAYGNLDVYGMGTDLHTYQTMLSSECVTEEMAAIYKDTTFSIDIITLDSQHYAELCSRADVPIGSVILLNQYSYNDFGEEIHLTPFTDALKSLELIKADGSSQEISIQGGLTKEQIPQELFYANFNPVRLVLPEAKVNDFVWYSAPADIDGFITYANQLMAEEFPSNSDFSYMEEGFDTRVYQTDEYMKVMNIAIALVVILMYSFVALLMLIGLTNVISTLSTNVLMRSKEFAVLKSVGMTPESLKRMLKYESILCSLKALLLGIPVGVAITILINLPIRFLFPIPYDLPWTSILLCTLIVFLITWGTTMYAAHKLKKQNIIETIRAEAGR